MFYCVTFLKTSSSSQVQHIHNIHHLLFQCQNKPQWCFHSPHLNTFTNLSPYNVEVQWHVSSASPSIQCQTQLVIIDHLGFHCVACFKSFSIHPGQMCPRLLEKKKKERKKERNHSLRGVQFSSVAHSYQHLCYPTSHSKPGLPVHHQLPWVWEWNHPAISSSEVPFSSCPQSFPVSGCFQLSQLFTSGSQIIGVSASTLVFSMNTKDWFPLGWTGWTS